MQNLIILTVAGQTNRRFVKGNRPAEHLHSRRLIGSAARIPPQLLADTSVDLKSLNTPT